MLRTSTRTMSEVTMLISPNCRDTVIALLCSPSLGWIIATQYPVSAKMARINASLPSFHTGIDLHSWRGQTEHDPKLLPEQRLQSRRGAPRWELGGLAAPQVRLIRLGQL